MKTALFQIFPATNAQEKNAQGTGLGVIGNTIEQIPKTPDGPAGIDRTAALMSIESDLHVLSTLVRLAVDYKIAYRVAYFDNEIKWHEYPKT